MGVQELGSGSAHLCPAQGGGPESARWACPRRCLSPAGRGPVVATFLLDFPDSTVSGSGASRAGSWINLVLTSAEKVPAVVQKGPEPTANTGAKWKQFKQILPGSRLDASSSTCPVLHPSLRPSLTKPRLAAAPWPHTAVLHLAKPGAGVFGSSHLVPPSRSPARAGDGTAERPSAQGSGSQGKLCVFSAFLFN